MGESGLQTVTKTEQKEALAEQMAQSETGPQPENGFRHGLKDGVPIGLGYLSVSFTFGVMAVSAGLPVWAAVVISMVNVTSAGQLAGLPILAAAGSPIEIAITQFVINIRYALMSLSLSQKLHRSVNLLDRFLIAFCNTDEVFAVASSKKGEVGKRYLYGLILAPYFGWALGTFVGAAATTLLPAIAQSALGIAIYGMFLAIIIPPAKHFRPVLVVVLVAVLLSCLLTFTPGLNQISGGFATIICAVIAAAVGARFFPLHEHREEADS